MQSNKNYQSLIYQVSQLSDEQLNFPSAINNLYSAIEKIQQQHQLYNPEFC